MDITFWMKIVNKQATVGLQHIGGQTAYMKPENSVFHVKFLGYYKYG